MCVLDGSHIGKLKTHKISERSSCYLSPFPPTDGTFCIHVHNNIHQFPLYATRNRTFNTQATHTTCTVWTLRLVSHHEGKDHFQWNSDVPFTQTSNIHCRYIYTYTPHINTPTKPHFIGHAYKYIHMHISCAATQWKHTSACSYVYAW